MSISLPEVSKIQDRIRVGLQTSHADFSEGVSTIKTSLLKIGNSYYLRTGHSNGYVSTTLLTEGASEKGRAITQTSMVGVSCTTKKCASTPECLPQGDYCTECKGGDCTKTVSN